MSMRQQRHFLYAVLIYPFVTKDLQFVQSVVCVSL